MTQKIRPGYSSHTQLLGMLSQGWKIEPPVYIRPLWRTSSEQENTYHFILWRGDRVNMVSISDCPEIHQFLAEQGLAVDRL
jgi:hypothetical protein